MTTPDDPLAALRAKFLVRCAEDLATLTSDIDAADPRLKYVIHRLSGTAGIFGFDAISALAAPIDDRLQDGQAPLPGQMEALAGALRAVT